MIVVSDTSPLNYLILIGQDGVLEKLYGRVLIPQAVWRELQSGGAPVPVQEWTANLPGWVEIREVTDPGPVLKLDPGEQEAIALAEQLKAELVLLDERRGREMARMRGLAVIGTLGVLEAAAEQGSLDLRVVMEQLQKTSFRASAVVIEEMLERYARREQE
jgi:predicted nucleic acid-binding protein